MAPWQLPLAHAHDNDLSDLKTVPGRFADLISLKNIFCRQLPRMPKEVSGLSRIVFVGSRPKTT